MELRVRASATNFYTPIFAKFPSSERSLVGAENQYFRMEEYGKSGSLPRVHG
jgi:hypothetical protein